MKLTNKDWKEWAENMLAKNPELTEKDIEAIFGIEKPTKSAMCVPKTLEEAICTIKDLDFPKEEG
tara:strand:+ start:136 stop:330 length:195 start_codon:yes stop_codon:yes gene_type:complete